jgi:hypothetical protein
VSNEVKRKKIKERGADEAPLLASAASINYRGLAVHFEINLTTVLWFSGRRDDLTPRVNSNLKVLPFVTSAPPKKNRLQKASELTTF